MGEEVYSEKGGAAAQADEGAASSKPQTGWRLKPHVYTASCFCALTLVLLTGWLLNAFVFPYYDTVLSWTREISTGINGLTLALVAVAATWKPRILGGRALIPGAVLCIAVGLVASYIGISSYSTPFLVIGATLTAVGRGAATVLVGLAFLNMPIRTVGITVAGACLASAALQGLFLLLPNTVGIVVFAVSPFAALFLAYPYAKKIMEHISRTPAPAELAVTQPSSYLPFSHQVFMCLLLFRVAYGYGLTFGEIGGAPLATTYMFLPLAIAFVAILLVRKPLNPDILFQVSFLLVIAGFLLLAAHSALSNAVVNTFLMAGAAVFDILSWFVLIALASKNTSGSVAVFAWGQAMNAIGVIVGANFGRITNAYFGLESPTVSLIAAAIAFLFIAYMVIVLRGFSFKDTIAGVVQEKKPVSRMDVSDLDERCAAISQEYGLTARETEVFNLLARGRNGRFVQEELVVSYNTVKAHVKHIYTKLGIHTQQELIDLVEGVGEN